MAHKHPYARKDKDIRPSPQEEYDRTTRILEGDIMLYPIGIQTFEDIRRRGFVYVDKTEQVFRLAQAGKYYFLSRPRRFGKSMFLSTLEAYFSGRKDLFEGLAIEGLEKEWKKYPIFHLDLNTAKYDSKEVLEDQLELAVSKWEKLYGNDPNETSVYFRFMGVVQRACEKTGEQVVILIDEYDKPMLQAIGNDTLQQEYRSTLKAFYSVLKTQDRYIRFAFLTGVTKFGKVSVFSDLNNLQDISMDERFYDICGITDKELQSVFHDSIIELAEHNGLTVDECIGTLRRQFDGYHFCRENTPGIYNPFSILNTFEKKRFNDYWFETGTPSFLVELLKKTDYRLDKLQQEEVTADVLNSVEAMEDNPIPVIYQSGYLTVKGYEERFRFYRLGFPNEEVEKGFVSYLLPLYAPQKKQSELFISQFIKDVESGDVEDFIERLQTFFEDNDYRVSGKMEIYFQNCMYVIFKMMGFYTQVERATSRGRIDVTIQTNDYVYIIEVKLDGSADEAIKQINDKGYANAFAKDSRKLYKIGVNFSSETRAIEDWKIG